MAQLLGYTYRIKNLTGEQKRYIDKSIACARTVHNKLIELYFKRMEDCKDMTKEDKNKVWSKRIKYTETFKDENVQWASWAASSIFEYEERYVYDAFMRWFKLMREGKNINLKTGKPDPNIGKPKIKKNRDKTSFTLRNRACKLEGNRIILPLFKKLGIKPLQFVQHRLFSGRVVHYTITREAGSAYYIAICVELDKDIEPLEKTNRTIAIDVGILKHITYLDDAGNTGTVENLRIYRKLADRIAFYGKQKERQVYNSNRWKKTVQKLGKLYARQGHIRKDFLDNETKNIIENYDTIVIEDMNVSEVVDKTNKETHNVSRKKRNNINKATYDVAWYKFRTMLEYKAKLYGKNVIVADKDYKSTQICHVCGNINNALEDVTIREWTCEKCHTHHDRDINACYNLMKYAGVNL